MCIEVFDNLYLRTLKDQDSLYASPEKISEQVKAEPQYKYGNVNREDFDHGYLYSVKDSIGRKITSLPFIINGLVQTLYHLTLAIFREMPLALITSRSENLKMQMFKVIRDLQGVYGNLSVLFNDRYGLFHIQESQFQKTCYEYFQRGGLDFSRRPNEFAIPLHVMISDSSLMQELTHSKSTIIFLNNCTISDLLLSKVRKNMKYLKIISFGDADLNNVTGFELCKLFAKGLTVNASALNTSLIHNKINLFILTLTKCTVITEKEKTEILTFSPFGSPDGNEMRYQRLIQILKNIEKREAELRKKEDLILQAEMKKAEAQLFLDWANGSDGLSTNPYWIDGPRAAIDFSPIDSSVIGYLSKEDLFKLYIVITKLDVWQDILETEGCDQFSGPIAKSFRTIPGLIDNDEASYYGDKMHIMKNIAQSGCWSAWLAKQYTASS